MKEFLNTKIDKIRINGTGFFLCAMSYIYISIIIFLIGWTKYIISIPVSIILIIAIYKYYKKYKKNLENVEPIYIDIKMLIALCITLFILSWILGWTGFARQAGDYIKHNSVLSDLTNNTWPVYYENNGESSMLTYYLGQYIMPAFIGKIFSSANLSLFFNGIWAAFGLLLATLGIFKVTKANTTSKQIIALCISLFFSTCVILSQALGKIFIKDIPISAGEWFMYNDEFRLQYSSNMTLLRWVFPQCIVPWITFSILYDNKFDIEHYVILCLPMLFYSSFSFVGMIIFLFVMTIIYTIKNKDIKLVLKKIFSLSNVIVGLTLGGVLLLYFLGNLLVPKPDNIGLQLVEYSGTNILVYICFIISFLPYTIVLFKENKNNAFYWIATVLLLVLPFFKMGLNNDLCMRASIIPLFVYTILTIKTLINEKSKIYTIALLVILVIGSISSIAEFYISLGNMSLEFIVGKTKYTLEEYANRNLNIPDDEKYNYYTYDLDSSIFYKFLVKEQINE